MPRGRGEGVHCVLLVIYTLTILSSNHARSAGAALNVARSIKRVVYRMQERSRSPSATARGRPNYCASHVRAARERTATVERERTTPFYTYVYVACIDNSHGPLSCDTSRWCTDGKRGEARQEVSASGNGQFLPSLSLFLVHFLASPYPSAHLFFSLLSAYIIFSWSHHSVFPSFPTTRRAFMSQTRLDKRVKEVKPQRTLRVTLCVWKDGSSTTPEQIEPRTHLLHTCTPSKALRAASYCRPPTVVVPQMRVFSARRLRGCVWMLAPFYCRDPSGTAEEERTTTVAWPVADQGESPRW